MSKIKCACASEQLYITPVLEILFCIFYIVITTDMAKAVITINKLHFDVNSIFDKSCCCFWGTKQSSNVHL